MFWPIYQRLGPLLEPCTDSNALRLTYQTPLRITDKLNNVLYDSGSYPLDMTVCLCPTPTLNALVLLAALGALAVLIFLVWLLVKAFTAPEPPLSPNDELVEEVINRMDQVSREYLRNV